MNGVATSRPEAAPAGDGREVYYVKVYRDHPAWSAYRKWFLIPYRLLRELYVGTYTRRGYGPTTEASSVVREIRRRHPGCVLVY